MRIRLDKAEYSQYEPGLEVITATVTALAVGVPVVVTLMRNDGYGAVATQTVTPAATTQVVHFDLRLADPTDGINYARQGLYHVHAVQDVTQADSRTFPVSVVGLERWKQSYLFGIPLFAPQVIAALNQPVNITGLTIKYVDEGMLKGTYTLAYTASTQSLTWGGGSPVVLSGTGLVLMHLLNPPTDIGTVDAYIEVEVDTDALPLADASDMILIDNWRLQDADLRRYLQDAYSWVQQQLALQLEATITTTDPLTTSTYYDEVAQPQLYERGHLLYLPIMAANARPLRKVTALGGYYGATANLTIPQEWIRIDGMGAGIDLLPISGGLVTQLPLFNGWGWAAINGNAIVPNFWHYTVTCGLRGLDSGRYSIREAISKKAAVLALTDLSLALSGGRSGSQVSRDGVSDTRSYSANGAYGEKIIQYDTWLTKTMPKLRSYFGGIDMVTL